MSDSGSTLAPLGKQPALRTHGIREFQHGGSDAALLAEEIATVGYTVLEDVVGEAELALARQAIDRAYALQVEHVGGEDELRRINDADVARCLVQYDDLFIEIAANERILAVVHALLGEHVVLMSQNGIINRPSDDHYQLTWHRDLNYQHFVSSRPLAVSALLCVDEFSIATGATHVLPATHKVESFPSPEYVARRTVPLEASAGSVLMFDSMLFHRAGENTSGHVRRAVNHIYTLPLVQQQISIPSALGGRFADDPRLRTLLGYSFRPGESAEEWRDRRLKR